VGAFLSEFEFQRFKPRGVLSRLLCDCDLIQVVAGSPAWALSVADVGKPIALQCATRAVIERRRRDSIGGGTKARVRRLMNRITDRLERTALRCVDAIQVENQWMLEFVRAVNTGRDVLIRYHPPGVDCDVFRPGLSRDLQSMPYILSVGRFDDPRKNVELLLEAYLQLSPSLRQKTMLRLAGLSGPAPAFWARVQECGLNDSVTFERAPDMAHLVRLYQGAAVFALSSDEEGLGIAILEAMSCGLPVVSTRSGGPEGIISDGQDGWLVPRNDVRELAKSLAKALRDPALNRQLGAAARRKVLAHYDRSVTGKAFLQTYEELLAR
jgi:D-inositol-3-phosphate glycosyltransferase